MEIKRRRIFWDLLKDFRKRNVHGAELKYEIEWMKVKLSYKKIKIRKHQEDWIEKMKLIT